MENWSGRDSRLSTPSTSYRSTGRSASDDYFTLLGDLATAKSARDWKRAAEIAHRLTAVLPEFVRSSKAQFGDVPPSIPVFTDGARAMAMVGDDEGLHHLLAITETIPALRDWEETVQDAVDDRRDIEKIRRLLTDTPGILQTDVKDRIGAEDGRRIAVLLRQLEEGGEIQRIRYKRTYLLGAVGIEIPLPDDHAARVASPASASSETDPQPQISTVFDRAHQSRAPLRSREVALDGLDYVPLPRAPLAWEQRKMEADTVEAADHFELIPGTPWEIEQVEKLPMEDRPDTAFRKMAPHADGSLMLDDLGNAQAFPGAPASAISANRSGEIIAESPLGWGCYRWQVNPMGHGFIAMDDAGVTHAYDARLNRVLATPLSEAPEMRALMRRYDFDVKTLKNHVRAVALSPDRSQYLFSVVDQAFVVGADGSPRWASQLPKQEGWQRIADVSGHTGSSADISRALRVLELDLPVELAAIRTSFRRLAKQWHPDVNRANPDAAERFKEISWAAELLSGLDPASLIPESDRAIYQRMDSQQTWETEGMRFTVQFGMQASEKQASDWIYAASFSADGGAYLAGYSGRIVRLDGSGRPLRAYDIGSVPRRIADTGDYLYFLTGTRLYILLDRALVRVVDVFQEGDLLMGQTGFGLLEKKRFRWFSEEGEYLGGIITRNPIRRIFSDSNGLVVETRRRRVRIRGAPTWWES